MWLKSRYSIHSVFYRTPAGTLGDADARRRCTRGDYVVGEPFIKITWPVHVHITTRNSPFHRCMYESRTGECVHMHATRDYVSRGRLLYVQVDSSKWLQEVATDRLKSDEFYARRARCLRPSRIVILNVHLRFVRRSYLAIRADIKQLSSFFFIPREHFTNHLF